MPDEKYLVKKYIRGEKQYHRQKGRKFHEEVFKVRVQPRPTGNQLSRGDMVAFVKPAVKVRGVEQPVHPIRPDTPKVIAQEKLDRGHP